MPARTWVTAVERMRRQDGIATRQELLGIGLPGRTLSRRLNEGLLTPVNSRVVALPGVVLDLQTLTRAAVLALPGAVPTGPSAAALLGRGPWDGMDLGEDPWLIHPRGRTVWARYVTHPEVRCVRSRGMLVACPSDAVIDLIRFWPREDALTIAHRALQLRTVTLDHLTVGHARLVGLGGLAQLGRVIADAAEGTRSEAERRLIELLRMHQISGWVANLRIRAGARTYEIDVAFPSALLAIEVDGRAFHVDARSFELDRRRQNDLVAAGWVVLRFTWADLVDRPLDVVNRIEAGLVAAQGSV